MSRWQASAALTRPMASAAPEPPRLQQCLLPERVRPLPSHWGLGGGWEGQPSGSLAMRTGELTERRTEMCEEPVKRRSNRAGASHCTGRVSALEGGSTLGGTDTSQGRKPSGPLRGAAV